MPNTDPNEIRPLLHLVRAGLAGGLLSKEEVVDWADLIITRDEEPHVFFIDLAMSSNKSVNNIIHFIADFLDFDTAVVSGRPLLGMLYRQYRTNKLDIVQTVDKLFALRYEASFTEQEMDNIYSLEHQFEAAFHGIYGSVQEIELAVAEFLSFYEGFDLGNYPDWSKVELSVDQKIDQLNDRQNQHVPISEKPMVSKPQPWWKFWR